jgi:hypothetical protein
MHGVLYRSGGAIGKQVLGHKHTQLRCMSCLEMECEDVRGTRSGKHHQRDKTG